MVKSKDITKIVLSVIDNCIYFDNDCKNLLDKSKGSYVTGYNSVQDLINRIRSINWYKSEMSTDDVLVATGRIKGFCGIYNVESLGAKDIIFEIPGDTPQESIPVVVRDKGQPLEFISIIMYKINNQYRYLTLSVGNNYKYCTITDEENKEFRLLDRRVLKAQGCNFVYRIDSTIASTYLIQTALHSELICNGNLLETVYKKHSINCKSYKEFIDILMNLRWYKLPGNYTTYYAKGITGYSKYPSLKDLNEDASITIDNSDSSGRIQVLVNNSKVTSDIITIRLFIDNSSVRVIGCYFGKNAKYTDIKDINPNKPYTKEELIKKGFENARVINYSPYDELDLNTIRRFIHPWLEDSEAYLENTPKCIIKSDLSFIKPTERKVFYKGVIMPEGITDINAIPSYVINDLVACCTDSINVAMINAYKQLTKSPKGNASYLFEIASNRWFDLGGIGNSIIACEPNIVRLRQISQQLNKA